MMIAGKNMFEADLKTEHKNSPTITNHVFLLNRPIKTMVDGTKNEAPENGINIKTTGGSDKNKNISVLSFAKCLQRNKKPVRNMAIFKTHIP